MMGKPDAIASAPGIVDKERHRGFSSHRGHDAYRVWIWRFFSLELPFYVCLLDHAGDAGLNV